MKLSSATLAALTVAIASVATTTRAGTVSVFDYNVVVTNNYTTTSHVQGDVFVKNMSYSNSPVFDGNVKVAGTLTANSSYINGASGKTFTTKSATSYSLNNASKAVDSTLSISALSSNLTSVSDAYAAMNKSSAASATFSNNGTDLSFTYSGAATSLAVFNVTLAQLTSVTDRIDFSLGNAASAVINVTGTGSGSLNANLTFSSIATSLIWNFVDASSFTLNRTLEGSVIGDSLSLTLQNSNVDGGVYVSNLYQYGEIHSKLFAGAKPTIPSGGVQAPAVPLPTAAMTATPLLAVLTLRRRR